MLGAVAQRSRAGRHGARDEIPQVMNNSVSYWNFRKQ
jgi:hypothetical protein